MVEEKSPSLVAVARVTIRVAVSKDAIDKTLTAYNYNNACANLKSVARDNLISAYIDDGEESKLYL